jgi:uncharacterized protein with ParB-like and HNH nuclease domain
MSRNKYKIKTLFKEEGIKQIIVPEIQRDYVWKKDNVSKLLHAIFEDAKKQADIDSNFTKSELEKLPPDLREKIERLTEEQKVFSNVGFIYAYEDFDYKNRYFLIDGQQRITTIFLLLLAVSVKNKREDYFRMNYFKDNLPIVDYKVREASHNFLISFILFILEGGASNDVVNQHWYYTNYNNDKTIKSLLNNYQTIEEYIEEKDLTVDYVENNIELWFFDIKRSQQGEELYIYMNSRGESVKANENIKAGLLERCSEEDKIVWGTKWENWQDFFWKSRNGNPNADEGFNEFLRWIIIIETVKSNPEMSVEALGSFLQEIRRNEQFSSEQLQLDNIECYYNALSILVNNTILVENGWFYGKTSIVDYIRLFPILMYLLENQQPDSKDLYRVARFFRNVSRLVDVAKNPDNQTVNAVRLMKDFLDAKYTDVVNLVEFSGINQYTTILTTEEVYKLTLYNNPPQNTNRDELEKTIWSTEDNNLLNGQIAFILYCADIEFEDGVNGFEIDDFSFFSDLFNSLFNKPSDLIRRALLSKGEYVIWDGYSTHLESNRYSFGLNVDEWKKILSKDEYNKGYIKSLLQDYRTRFNVNNDDNNIILQSVIQDYLNAKPASGNWFHPFIEHESLMAYCEQKKVCYKSNSPDNIFLMKGVKATNYKPLSEFTI